jgi:hypothetical protein
MLKYDIILRLPSLPSYISPQTTMSILSVGLKARAELELYVARVIGSLFKLQCYFVYYKESFVI